MSTKQTASGAAGQAERQGPQGRTTAERVSLAMSLIIVLALLGTVAYTYLTQPDRPAIVDVELEVEAVRMVREQYYLPLRVTNRGDQTAEDVRVVLTLNTGTARESVEVVIRFLAGGETARAVAVFDAPPSEGELATTISYIEP